MTLEDWKKQEAKKIQKVRLMLMKLKSYKQNEDKILKNFIIKAEWELESAVQRLT